METELPEETVESNNKIPANKRTSSDQRGWIFFVPHPPLPPGNGELLDSAGGEGDEGLRSNIFGKGTCTVNNSCKHSPGYWKDYNLGVFFPKSAPNGKQALPFLKEHSTISLLSLESALGAPGMKGALGMKADIYDYCLKGTERNTNVKCEWLLVLKDVL